MSVSTFSIHQRTYSSIFEKKSSADFFFLQFFENKSNFSRLHKTFYVISEIRPCVMLKLICVSRARYTHKFRSYIETAQYDSGLRMERGISNRVVHSTECTRLKKTLSRNLFLFFQILRDLRQLTKPPVQFGNYKSTRVVHISCGRQNNRFRHPNM